MKRPVILAMGAAAFGALFGWATSMPIWYLIPLLLATLLLTGENKKRGLFACVILVVTVLHARELQIPTLADAQIGENVPATFVVTAYRSDTAYSKRYLASVVEGPLQGERVLLQTTHDTKDFAIGEIVRAQAEVLRPDRTQNDELFSYRDYLKRNGIDGLVRIKGKISTIGYADNFSLAARRDFFEKTDDALHTLFTEEQMQLMTTILTARSQISDEREATFRNIGVTHMLAVSGLHAGILFGLSIAVFTIGLKRPTARLIALLLLFAYAWVIGFPISVVRALIMAFVLTLARNLRAPYDPLTALFFAVTLVLMLFPGSITDAGFHLSAIGVWAVLWVRPVLMKQYPARGELAKVCQAGIAIQLGILPVLLYHFHTAPLAALLANLILIPVFSMMVTAAIPVLLLYFVMPPVASALAFIPRAMVDAFLLLTEAIEQLSLPIFQSYSVGIMDVLWIYLLLYLSLRPQLLHKMPRTLLRGLMATAVLSLAANGVLSSFQPPEVLILDVGQGDAALIKERGRHVLIDTGGEVRPESPDTYTGVVRPSLAREAVHGLTGIFVSHFDNDHIENLEAVLKNTPTQAVFAPRGLQSTDGAQGLEAICKAANTPLYWLSTGDRIRLTDASAIEVLYAAEDKAANDSFVLRYRTGAVAILFPGDLEEGSEKRILDRDLQADILKVGHHGSATSTSQEFLDAVGPRTAIISAGFANSYGHPHPDVMKRLEHAQADVFRTDHSGNIRIKITNHGSRIHTYPTSKPDLFTALSFLGMIPIGLWVKKEGRRSHYVAYRLSKKA